MGIKLVVVGGKQAGMEIPVRGPKFLIGRGEGCHLRTPSHTISRKHCLIRVKEGVVTIEDCGSTNGTSVNGEKIQSARQVINGDHIKVGILELEVRLPEKAAEAKRSQVHAVESAGHLSASSPPLSDDLVISKWLAEDDDEPQTAPPVKKLDDQSQSTAMHDTIAGQPLDDTTTSMPADQSPEKKGKKQPMAITSRFKQPPKPKAESSRSAAEEMLKHFFPRKKS